MKSRHALAPRARLVPLLALWFSLGVGVPAAMAQIGNPIWSIQLHAGLFAPMGASGASPTVGMRYGKHFGSHVQGGLLTGWTLKSRSLEAPVGGLQTTEAQVEVARFDAHLLPLMGFVQVNFTSRSRLVPFAGVGAGYEWLVLEANDHRTGVKSSATYANLAWETFGGIGLRLNRIVRVNGELFYNGGSLERVVHDSAGNARHEAVDVNGVGARVGLDMIFQ
jgi:hypothetical protein